MALHPDFPGDPHVILDPAIRWFPESPAKVKRILDEHKVRLYRVSELPQLIDEIRRTGKDLSTLRMS